MAQFPISPKVAGFGTDNPNLLAWSFAFEISITTEIDHEVQNIAKCCKAGFTGIVAVCLEEDKLAALRQAANIALPAEMSRVSFCIPANLSAKLIELSASCKSNETVTHGRKTKVTYQALSAEEARARRQTLAEVTAGSIQKLSNEKKKK